MLFTAKTSYGIRALINLALMYGAKKPVPIKDIAEEEGISRVYLEQIFNRFKKKGVVKSSRGPKGGYFLTKDPAEVTIYDVVRALDGEIDAAKCFSGKRRRRRAACPRAEKCAPKELWDEVGQKIQETLEAVSLRDLASRTVAINPDKFALTSSE